MTSFTITVKDEGVQSALKALASRVNNMATVLDTIGTGIITRTQRRFDTSTSPDGTPWAAYPIGGATITMLTARLAGSKSNRKKDGSLNAKGTRSLAGKKLLIDSTHLKTSFHSKSVRDALVVSSSQQYAAIHQFGGTTGANSMIPGKKIEARPFLPIRKDGTLYPQEQATVLQALNDFLVAGF